MMRHRKGQSGFTIIEVLVTTVLVSVAVVASLGGIRALSAADSAGKQALLLQRLAAEKIDDLRILPDPSQAGSTGDFMDRGYTDITWTADVEPTSVSNVDNVTVTVTQGKASQEISTLIYIPTSTSTTTSTTAAARSGT